MKRETRRISIIVEVAALFLAGVITTGFLTYFSEIRLYSDSVKGQTEMQAKEIANEVKSAVTEYPSYRWLIEYWYEHADELEIEYDAAFSNASLTSGKSRGFSMRNPQTQIKYAVPAQCEALSEEDQKLFAEIAYSWLITRVNQIKRSYNVAYLFCVISEEPYSKQFFLFSAADRGAIRGTNYEEVYPLGKTVEVAKSQTRAMRSAVKKSSYLTDAGDYLDFYTSLCSFGGRNVLIGLTYDLSDYNASIRNQTLKGTRLAIVNQFTLYVICLAVILVFVLRPLKKVQSSIRSYKKTKDSDAVTAKLALVKSHNEIGRLAEDVSEMVDEIDSHMKEIQAISVEKERIETELSLATRIQADMLPNEFPAFPGNSEFDIYAVMDPAREVGGDFYDFFLVDDDHLCLLIADVSGKGIPAALFMMASKIILADNAMMGKSPARILTDTNLAICANNREEMFVTVWLGILELSTGRLTAANAGHEYPVLRQPDGAFELLRDRHGFVLGGMDSVKYKEYEIMLEPGAKLFLYTDGVPEATDSEGNLFGTERMLAALNGGPDAAPDLILKNVRAAVDGFVKESEQFDDLTMLCLSYEGRKNDTLTIDAETENINAATGFIRSKAGELPFSDKALYQIEVSSDEIVTNIVRYAYGENKGKVIISVCSDESGMTVTFSDRGAMFDPLKKEDPDVTLPAGERGIGGYGIYIVKKLMDNVSYEYRDGMNVLTIRKNFDKQTKA